MTDVLVCSCAIVFVCLLSLVSSFCSNMLFQTKENRPRIVYIEIILYVARESNTNAQSVLITKTQRSLGKGEGNTFLI